jgi:hypothetical protein
LETSSNIAVAREAAARAALAWTTAERADDGVLAERAAVAAGVAPLRAVTFAPTRAAGADAWRAALRLYTTPWTVGAADVLGFDVARRLVAERETMSPAAAGAMFLTMAAELLDVAAKAEPTSPAQTTAIKNEKPVIKLNIFLYKILFSQQYRIQDFIQSPQPQRLLPHHLNKIPGPASNYITFGRCQSRPIYSMQQLTAFLTH